MRIRAIQRGSSPSCSASSRSFRLYVGSVSRHPPAGCGYSLSPNFFASSICGLRERPSIAKSLLRSTHPSCSGTVAGISSALSGRNSRPSYPDSRATTCRVPLPCDIGRWPATSPVAIRWKPFASIHSPARRIIRVWQSMQGFMPDPNPCFGFRINSRISSLKSSVSRASFSARAALIAGRWSKNSLRKTTPRTSIPCSRNTHTASWLSSPPENRQTARTGSGLEWETGFPLMRAPALPRGGQ